MKYFNQHTSIRSAAHNRTNVVPASAAVLERRRGFSLVEILVGLAIGMIAMVVVMQVFSASEANKRTTTGADDAEMGGAIGLYSLESDLRHSGYGIANLNMLNCSLQLRGGVVLTGLAPVTINHASIPPGDASTDTLLIVYGQSNFSTEGDVITSATGNDYKMTTNPQSNTRVGDLVIATPVSGACGTLILDTVTSVTSTDVFVQTGAAGMSFGTLFNMGNSATVGQNFVAVAYAIRGGTLTKCDYMVNDCSSAASTGSAAVWVPVAGNIVSLRAQYGQDTSSVGALTGVLGKYDQVTPTIACGMGGWVRTVAIRLAMVSRSGQYDKSTTPYATPTAPSWEGSVANNPTGSTAAPIDLTGTNANISAGTWMNYRYKVYEAVVPIRNVNWMRKVSAVATGC